MFRPTCSTWSDSTSNSVGGGRAQRLETLAGGRDLETGRGQHGGHLGQPLHVGDVRRG